MSRFRKLSRTIWHCHYHIVWALKYRYRILTRAVGQEVEGCIRSFTALLGGISIPPPLGVGFLGVFDEKSINNRYHRPGWFISG